MRKIHIVGSKNHGKTTLLVAVIEAATRRGLRVGAIKHTHHQHEVDRYGTDSYRLRNAGAAPAAFVSDSWAGIFLPCNNGLNDKQLEALFSDCDLVLVEGNLDSEGTKIEVWRGGFGRPPLAQDRTDITAVVTDDTVDLPLPILPRADLEPLLDHLLDLAGISDNPAVSNAANRRPERVQAGS